MQSKSMNIMFMFILWLYYISLLNCKSNVYLCDLEMYTKMHA